MISSSDESDCGDTTRLISSESLGAHLKKSETTANCMHISRSRSAAVMLACLFMNMCCIGMYAGLGVIYVELISALHSERSDAALVQTLYLGLSMGGGLLFTKMVTKYDPGICVMVASTIAGVAVACSYLAPNIGTVIFLVGIVAGLSASVNLISAFSVINWAFVDNRKFALSILTVGIAVGQTILPFITDALVNEYSWSGTFLIFGALLYFNCIPCGLIIHFSKRYFKTGKDKTLHSKVISIRYLISNCVFLIYLTALFIEILLGPIESWFIVDVAVMKGIDVQLGAILLSLNGIFSFVGMIVCTVVLKFYPDSRPELHMSYGYVMIAGAHVCIIVSPVYWGMALGMILRGLSTGFTFAFLPSLQLELHGPEGYPQITAISYLVMGVGDVIGGYIGGYSVDATGSYDLIFYIATACAIYSALCMILIYVILKRKKRHREQLQRIP